MSRREMTALGRVPVWMKVAATFMMLAVAFLAVAADFASFPAVSRFAHRVHLPAVVPPLLLALTRAGSASLATSPVGLHETMHSLVIDLTCCRRC
jgi:hypothetical protein